MKDMTLLVMAAGMGSRYGGLKQLDAVGPNGETIIDFSVYDAIRAGYNKVVFIIRKDFEKQFKQKVSNKYKNKIDVWNYCELDPVRYEGEECNNPDVYDPDEAIDTDVCTGE